VFVTLTGTVATETTGTQAEASAAHELIVKVDVLVLVL